MRGPGTLRRRVAHAWRRVAHAWRRAALAAAIAYMVSGPAYTAATGEIWAVSPPWLMYEDVGATMCAAAFEVRRGGEVREVPLAEVLGHARGEVDEASVSSVARQLCTRSGAGAAVHVSLRCASLEGWTEVLDGRLDACARGGAVSARREP